jgi:hypothetical protein
MQKYVSVRGGSRHARLKLFGYYVQRACTSRTLRRIATRALIAGLGALHGPARPATRPLPEDAPALDDLHTHGYLHLDRLMSDHQCAEALDYLRQQDMVPARRDGRPFRIDAVPPGCRVGDYPLATLVHCPHIMAVANHPDVLRVAAGYLGYTPTISLMGLRWTFPGDGAPEGLLDFHRDSEPASIKLMVYLTDVDLQSGPHSYVPGTHRDRMPVRLRHYSDAEVMRDHGSRVDITGPAGTSFFVDTRGIHKGTLPERTARLMLIVQYSLLPCLVYDYAPVAYPAHSRFDPYVNRLMIATGNGHAPMPAAPGESPAPSLRD